MKKILPIILLLICMTLPVFAETKEASIQKVGLTFEQAYQLMLENNNSLKAFEEQIKKSKYERNAAIGQYLPKVVVNATYMHFSDPIAVTTPVSIPALHYSSTLTTHVQDKDLFTVGGAVVWNIFTGGKIVALNSAARAKLEASNSKYVEVQDNLTVELVKRYYGLRLARDVVSVRAQVMEGIKKHLDDAKALEREGMISKSERLHAEVAYADAQRQYKASLRDANVIEEGLKTLIKSKDADLKDVLIYPDSLLFAYNDSTIDVAEMKKNALENNPQLKQLKAKKKALNAKFRSEVANYSPNVSLFAYDVVGAKDLSQSFPRAGIGGSVNFLLFDGFSRYNNVRAADADRHSVDYEIADAEYNIESLVTKQYQELMKNKEMYESSNASMANAEESLRTASLGFKEGFRTSLDVTDAELALSKVKIERLQSLYNYDLTLCELLKTNGNTKEFLNYIINSKGEKF